MSPALFRYLIALLLLVGGSGGAFAHTRSESHTSWTIDGRLVRVDVTVPDLEAKRIDPGAQRPTDVAMIAYLRPRIGVIAANKECPIAAPPRVMLAAPHFRRTEFIFDCPGTADMSLHFDAFFELVSTHIDLAQIQFQNGDFVEQLFTANAQTLDLKASQGGELADAGFLRFVEMGIMHIFTGVDHMSFLLGLVLISRRLRDLIFVVTGFTIGHSLTLGLAVTGLLRPHGEYIDALVALTIALIGIENIVVTLKKPNKLALAAGGFLLVMAALRLLGYGSLPPLLLLGAAIFTGCYLLISGHLQDTGRLRMVVTMVFGLIHGFGFAADLLENRLPREKLAEILVGFNLGVEIGQLTIVLLVTGIVVLARRMRFATPRAITTDVLASWLVGLGMFWFIGRSFTL
ncbi:MAG: HupE/UreJ family protein [Sphingomonas sp.]